jgi:hypothetical protein
MNNRRRGLLRPMSRIEQLMAEAEALTVDAPDNQVLLRASALFAEHRPTGRCGIGTKLGPLKREAR